MIAGCGRQMRAGMGGPYALDFSAVLAMGTAAGADTALMADVLPAMERILLDQLSDDGD